jgi:Flp pilus assembly protein TadG
MTVTAARNNSHCTRGQASTEFAYVATALLLLITGMMMMSEAVLDYNSMSSAAEEAVRYAVANGPNSPAPATTTQIQQIAINTASSVPLTTSNVVVSWINDANMSTRQDVKVVVSYDFPLKVPWMTKVTLHLQATSQMMAAE